MWTILTCLLRLEEVANLDSHPGHSHKHFLIPKWSNLCVLSRSLSLLSNLHSLKSHLYLILKWKAFMCLTRIPFLVNFLLHLSQANGLWPTFLCNLWLCFSKFSLYLVSNWHSGHKHFSFWLLWKLELCRFRYRLCGKTLSHFKQKHCFLMSLLSLITILSLISVLLSFFLTFGLKTGFL